MDNAIETPETNEIEELSIGKALAKSFALSTAVSAGTIAGFMVGSYAIGKFVEIIENRKSKKAAKLEVVTTED